MIPLTEEQSALVEQYLPKVAVLSRVLAVGVSHANADDLYSAGCEGLIEAAQRYDVGSNVPFGSFAYYRVRGAMIDAARRAAPHIRRRSRAVRVLQASQALLEHAQRVQPSGDVSDPRTLRERVEAAAELVAQTTAAVMLSRLRPIDPETVADPDGNPEDRVLHLQTLARLRALVESKDPEAQQLITALYAEGLSMHEYAAKIGVSVSTVSRHHARLLASLASAMQVDEPSAATPSAATHPNEREPGAEPGMVERPTASPRGPPRVPES